MARLRYSPLPETVALFPSPLLDSALTKIVQLGTTLLCNVPSIRPGFLGNLRLLVGLLDCRRLALGRRALLGLVLLRSRRRRLPLLASLVRRGRIARVKLLFPLPLKAPAAPEVKAKEPERSRPVRVGGCLAPHWRRWQAIGAESWVKG